MTVLKPQGAKRYRYWAPKVSIACLLLLITPMSFAAYQSQGHKIGIEIHQMLIDNNYCDNAEDCVKKDYVFWNGHIKRKGFSIYIYNIKDRHIINKINNIIINTYFKHNQTFAIRTRFYATTHKNTNRLLPSWLGGAEPFIYFELSKHKDNEK